MSDALRHMAKGGKTFYFASMWLERAARRDAAVAYSFCRTIDDIADTVLPGKHRSETLERLLRAISTHDTHCSETREMLALIERFPQIREPVLTLVEACNADTAGIRIANTTELLRYAHGVAGTVGLIMYPILGGTALEGTRHAADLGIAMQCTNIARDVLSDLKDNRIYLPQEWLGGVDLYGLFRHESQVEQVTVAALHRLLALANEHYRNGLQGLSYLHPRCRFAIRVAADCYAAIGERVIRENALVRERAVVPLSSKVLIMLRASQSHKRGQAAIVSGNIR